MVFQFTKLIVYTFVIMQYTGTPGFEGLLRPAIAEQKVIPVVVSINLILLFNNKY